MRFIPGSAATLVIFSAICGLTASLVIIALRRRPGRPRPLAVVGLYLAAFVMVVASGCPRQFVLPLAPLLFLSVLAVALWLSLSRHGRDIGDAYSLGALTAVQGFRLPLELVLHEWAATGTVPPTMTWSGQNWDIASGIISLLAAPFAGRFRFLAWGAQILGIGLLANVIRVALFSLPLPFAWPLENPLRLIFELPYALIGPLCVGFALAAHIITMRKLWRARR